MAKQKKPIMVAQYDPLAEMSGGLDPMLQPDAMAPEDAAMMEPSQADINQSVEQQQVSPVALAPSGGSSAAQQLLQMVNSPEYNQKRFDGNQALADQRAGIKTNEDLIKQIEGKDSQVDLSPLLAYVDSTTGSKLAQSYKAPSSAEEKAMKVLELRDKLQGQKASFTKEQLQLLKDMSPAQLLSKAANMDYQQKRTDALDKRLGLADDKLAADAVKSVDRHPLMQRSTKQLGQLQIDRHTLETSPIISPQILHEISNGIAVALGGGGQVGLGLSQMQDLSTLKSDLAKSEQYLTNSPQEAASPAVRKQIIDTLNRLEEAYGKYQHNLAMQLRKGLSFKNSAQARAGLDAAVKKYEVPSKDYGIPVGKVEDGHQYIGGDPSKPESWKEVK